MRLIPRTDFFPGLGWMLTKRLWEELRDKWPPAYWDEFLRTPEVRKNRSCIRPEISRTITFGSTGVSGGQFFNTHLRFIELNQQHVDFSNSNLSYLLPHIYNPNFHRQTSMATSSSDGETARRKSTRQRRSPFDGRYWELGEPPMSPGERESDQEFTDTLSARRQQNDTVCHDPSCRAMISDIQADIRRQGKTIAFLRKQLAWVIKSNLKILENQHTMQVNDTRRQPAPGSSEAAFLTNPLRRPISTKSDFQEVNSRLHDPQAKSQMTNFLVCLGGRNTDDFVKRVFYALFDDEASINVYEVIKDVYAVRNKGGRVDIYELEAAFTRRLKRSLDALRKRRSRPDSLIDDSDGMSDTDTSSLISATKESPLLLEPQDPSPDEDVDPGAEETRLQFVRRNFHCIECSYFCPVSPEKSSKSATCHCGEFEESHARFKEDTSSGTWHSSNLREITQSNSFGSVYFSLENAMDNKAQFLRLSYKDDVNALRDYITKFWDILSPRRPKLCLSILTSQYKSRISEDRKIRIIEEVLSALKSTDAWLVNDGLNVTFNILIGKALSKVSTNYFGDDTEFTPPKTIGVCPWGSIRGRNCLMNNNIRTNYVEYKASIETEEGTTHSLLPFNSHLIFVDDGYRREEVSVAKTGFRAKFEKMISAPAKKNVLNVPLVDLVIGGDLATLHEAANAVENDICVLVLKGSGFAADIIAHAYELRKQLRNRKFEKFPDQQRQSIERAALTIVKTDTAKEVVPLVERIISKPALIGIYNLEDDEPLSSELMRLIMFHATDTLAKLYLSLSWRKIDLAEELVLQNHADIKAKSLYGLLMTALLNDQLDFVKLLLKLGVDLQDFLTVDRLHCLYNFARHRGSFVSSLSNADLGRRFVKESLPPEEEWVIQESKVYSLHCEGSDAMRAAFAAFLGHFVDKKVQSYVDTLRAEEEARLTRVSKTTVYLSTVSKFLGPDFNLKLYAHDIPQHFSRTEMSEIRFQEPADHLTIWAATHTRLEMATFFLSLSSHPVCLAIFVAALFRKMGSYAPAYDTKNIDMYEAFAQEFEGIAVEMVGVCEEQDSRMTTAMLLEYKPSWERESTPVAAANSDSLNFVSSSPFQNLVSLTWENGVNFSFLRLLLVLTFPFLLLSKKFQVNKPLYATIDEMKASVPAQFLEGDQQSATPKPIDLDAFLTKISIFYRSPRTKFALNFIALIVFLVLLSYTLLFELYRTRMSYCEMIVMIYSLGWIVENIYATHCSSCIDNHSCELSNKYNWDLVFNIFYYPYFQLFGEMSFEFYNAEDACNGTFNECPRHNPVVPVLHAAYMLIAVLIFLNLLIAVFRQVSSVLFALNCKSRNIWLQNRFRIVFYFDRIGVMPAPFSTLHVAYSLLKRLFRLCARPCRATPTALPETVGVEITMDRMAKHRAPNNPRSVWRQHINYYAQMEYGMRAYLHRFQEYCGNVYYKTVEKASASSFDTQLNCIMRRLEELQKKHEHFMHYLPGKGKAHGQQRKATEEEYIRLTASQRLKALRSHILKAIDRVAKLTEEVSSE
nr:unnamed protein product [Spirometra erinaceieuropaei]